MPESNFMTVLGERIFELKNPSLLGLDPKLEYLPEYLLKDLARAEAGAELEAELARALFRYNEELLSACSKIIPAVKFQMAYYEQYGIAGLRALQDSIGLAKSLGYQVIIDGKRNDIGATAEAYARAFLKESKTPFGQSVPAFQGDALTVNFYLGEDGVKPFADELRTSGKGIFLLLRTSNPSGKELQDMQLADGRKAYESLAERCAAWAEKLRDKSEAYSPIGVVVGATYPKEAARLRQNFPHLFFLVPGYGAQGASAKDVAVAFDRKGGGAIINSSRGLMNAWQALGYEHREFAKATQEAALAMRAEFSQFMKF
ncbi:MAG: orotidine-5'-phosphate decarboxylase [Eubacteriales bacterium]|nr:orotidine-5'-phosphate decarboxylase [Eubacteriales bacterium]